MINNKITGNALSFLSLTLLPCSSIPIFFWLVCFFFGAFLFLACWKLEVGLEVEDWVRALGVGRLELGGLDILAALAEVKLDIGLLGLEVTAFLDEHAEDAARRGIRARQVAQRNVERASHVARDNHGGGHRGQGFHGAGPP